MKNAMSTYLFLIRCQATLGILIIFTKKQFREFAKQSANSQIENDYVIEGEFTTSWFRPHIPVWSGVLPTLFSKEAKIEILEIGSWEGMSTVFLAQEFSHANLTSVDTWGGSDEHDSIDMTLIEKRFDKNVKMYERRVQKVKSTSQAYFSRLSDEELFDIIYVDGSHHLRHVIIDAFEGFAHLRAGGILIFDDYLWQFYPRALDNVAAALHSLVRLNRDKLEVIYASRQLIIRKTH